MLIVLIKQSTVRYNGFAFTKAYLFNTFSHLVLCNLVIVQYVSLCIAIKVINLYMLYDVLVLFSGIS